jgi:hypothetical protein
MRRYYARFGPQPNTGGARSHKGLFVTFRVISWIVPLCRDRERSTKSHEISLKGGVVSGKVMAAETLLKNQEVVNLVPGLPRKICG